MCFGIAMAFFPIRPFWNDEWRLIYNIKFKSEHQLWGRLDLLQQCPRVFLILLKKVTAFFDYSYISLRLPALVITTASIPLCFYLRKKVFPNGSVYTYLFILILISSQTFTDYIVQMKQYEMEIFLCLLTLWQLMTLLDIGVESRVNKLKYLLLCFTFLVAPFLSYTYPIAVAPLIPIVIISSVMHIRNRQLKSNKLSYLLSLYLPLLLVCAAIVVFYIVDVKQLMVDNNMYQSYKKMLDNERSSSNFIRDFWGLFSLVGSGALYEIIFGVLGITSFFYGMYRLIKNRTDVPTRQDYFKLYAIMLLLLTLALFLSGKLLGEVARLTAFTVPSIAILIVSFFEDLGAKYNYQKLANIITAVLFLGLFGNIIVTFIDRLSFPEYKNRIETYRHTAKALRQARLNKEPILITDGVRGDKINRDASAPGKILSNTITPQQIAGMDTLCTEVILKVNPEYKVWDTIPVYIIPDMKWTKEYMAQLPSDIKSATFCDGINFMRVYR